MTGLDTQWKVEEREQDSRETEREIEHCCKWAVVSVINLAIGENIYDGYRRIILDQ